MALQEIGIVQFVQIQRAPMKIDIDGVRTYRPDPLLTVAALRLTRDGIVGMSGDSGGAYDETTAIVDVHHAYHPQTRNRGDNGISIGFVQHYASMRDRFGPHMTTGIGGESVIVKATMTIEPAMFDDVPLVIRSAVDDKDIALTGVYSAPPCEPFARFCAQQPPDVKMPAAEMKSALQFLDQGRRGFYATLRDDDPQAIVRAGDMLLAAI